MFQTSRTTNRLLSSCVGVVLACAGTAFAQDSSTQQTTTSVDIPPPGVSTFELPRSQDWEAGFFFGASFWQQKNSDPLKEQEKPSAMVGGYFTENFSEHLGTEQTFAFAENQLRFHQLFGGVLEDFNVSQHVYQFQDSMLFYFTNRRSNFRPYVRAGFGVIGFAPTQNAKNELTSVAAAPLNAAQISTDPRFAFTYGAGIKVRLAEHIGIRGEVYGVIAQDPHYGLAVNGIPPQLYIPAGGVLNGIQIDSGLYFTWGHKDTYTLQVMRAWDSVSVAASGNNVCPGPAITVKATVTGRKSFAVPNYRWTIDGHEAGSNTDTLTVPTDTAGQHQIGLTVVDSGSLEKSTVPPITLTVNAHTPPTITATADKTDLQVGDKAMLYPHPQAGSCPGSLSVAWTVSDGTVTGTDPATYDSATVQFGPEGGTKQITATATVTDSAGGTAAAPVNLTVTAQVKNVRQDDIIFPTGNSRVNNCGKRILIDQVYPALTSGQYANYDVVLVGHMGNEAVPPPPGRRGRRARAAAAVSANLAMERALHTAEILASGQGICPKPGIDISRIKIATVGAGQGADLRKPICAASIRERKASRIEATDDQLKDQRVEIWFVPRGANMPQSATGAQQAPDTIHTECPK